MNFGREQGSALEQETGVAVLNGEGKAELAVLGTELALEVGGPGAIGLRQDGQGRTRMGTATPWLTRLDAAFPCQDAVHGIDARRDLDGGVVNELFVNLAGSPAALVTDLEDPGHDLWRGGVSAGVGAVRAVLEAIDPLGSIAFEPEVAGRPGDVVAPAEFGVRQVGEFRLDDETGAFLLHGGGSPRHRALPVEGAPRLRGEL